MKLFNLTRLREKSQIMTLQCDCTTVPVLMCFSQPDSEAVNCAWIESDEIVRRRRQAFCHRVEGFAEVCRCRHPVPIVFNPALVFTDNDVLSCEIVNEMTVCCM